MRAACPKTCLNSSFFEPFICGKVILLPWFRAQYIFIINQVISYEHSTAENNVQTVYTAKMGEVWQQLQHKMIKFIYSAGTGTRKTGWFNGRTCGTCCIYFNKMFTKRFPYSPQSFNICSHLHLWAMPRGGTRDLKWRGWSRDFFGFEIFDSGIFLGAKIWQVFFLVAWFE